MTTVCNLLGRLCIHVNTRADLRRYVSLYIHTTFTRSVVRKNLQSIIYIYMHLFKHSARLGNDAQQKISFLTRAEAVRNSSECPRFACGTCRAPRRLSLSIARCPSFLPPVSRPARSFLCSHKTPSLLLSSSGRKSRPTVSVAPATPGSVFGVPVSRRTYVHVALPLCLRHTLRVLPPVLSQLSRQNQRRFLPIRTHTHATDTETPDSRREAQKGKNRHAVRRRTKNVA